MLSAQLPAGKMPAEEKKQMIAEIKKEIATLEEEIKKAEIEDPDALPMLGSQLSTYKNMLTALDKTSTSSTKKTPASPGKATVARTPSPLVSINIKQPVPVPTAAQARDRYFWYKGKKINDSTLITVKGTLVQYQSKKNKLVVQPEQKKDAFAAIAKEITLGEQRKNEMYDKFDKVKNGFIYYPFIKGAIAQYDDATSRFSDAVKNTISFEEKRPVIASVLTEGNDLAGAKGPFDGTYQFPGAIDEGVIEWVSRQLDEAKRKISQLPPIESFPAPPTHNYGRCGTCDTTIISRERKLYEDWLKKYQEHELEISRQALTAMREYGLLGGEEMANEINTKFFEIVSALFRRADEKNKLLLDRYGNDLQYFNSIVPVILGNERQKQLLGAGEESSILGELVGRMNTTYWKYYNEQVAARNHDFVLNVPVHLGYLRQMALLGAEDNTGLDQVLDKLVSYNRFALTLDIDFIFQAGSDQDLSLRATGKMETAEKIYTMLYPDSCRFRMMAYQRDLSNTRFTDISLPMKVNGGVRTSPDEEGKMKDYPYKGASQYEFRFPDASITFCGSAPDTLFLSMFAGNESVAARAESDMANLRKAYTIDMLGFAGQVLFNEDENEFAEGMHDAGTKMLNNISGFMQQSAPANTLEKLRIQYEGYISMDDMRKEMESAYNTKKSYLLFNANNLSSILADSYIDTKRKIDEDVEVKKGMFHLRISHEPVGK